VVRRAFSGAPTGPTSGQIPLWIPLALLVSCLAWLVASLQGDLDLVGFTRIDPSRTRIEAGNGLVDARWRETLSARLASLPRVPDGTGGPALTHHPRTQPRDPATPRPRDPHHDRSANARPTRGQREANARPAISIHDRFPWTRP
jgi:hypothetical protein